MIENFHPSMTDDDIEALYVDKAALNVPKKAQQVRFNSKTRRGYESTTASIWSEKIKIEEFSIKETTKETFAEVHQHNVRIRFKVVEGENEGAMFTHAFQLYPSTLEKTFAELKVLKEESPQGDPRRQWGAKRVETMDGYQMMSHFLVATGNIDRLLNGKHFAGLHTIGDFFDGSLVAGITIRAHFRNGALDYNGEPEGTVITHYTAG